MTAKQVLAVLIMMAATLANCNPHPVSDVDEIKGTIDSELSVQDAKPEATPEASQPKGTSISRATLAKYARRLSRVKNMAAYDWELQTAGDKLVIVYLWSSIIKTDPRVLLELVKLKYSKNRVRVLTVDIEERYNSYWRDECKELPVFLLIRKDKLRQTLINPHFDALKDAIDSELKIRDEEASRSNKCSFGKLFCVG